MRIQSITLGFDTRPICFGAPNEIDSRPWSAFDEFEESVFAYPCSCAHEDGDEAGGESFFDKGIRGVDGFERDRHVNDSRAYCVMLKASFMSNEDVIEIATSMLRSC